MFGIGHHKTISRFGVLVDIGSGSVGVGIVESNPNEKLPRLLFMHRTFMRMTKRGGTESEQIRQMREALLSANLVLSIDGMAALREREPHAELTDILVVCSAPWAHTSTRSVAYKNEESFKVTPELVHDLTSSAEEEATTSITEKNHIQFKGYEIVEHSTVDVRVNDYPIKNPYGLKGVDISLHQISGLIPKEILSSVQEVHDKLYPKSTITAHTSMLVHYCVLRNMFPHTDSFAIIDVTGEATEIGIVEQGLLIDATHTPFGSNTLVRHIVEKSGKTVADVQTLLQGYTAHTLSDEARNEIETDIATYRLSLNELIETLREKYTIPKTLIIIAQPIYYSLFKDVIPTVIGEATLDTYSILPVDELMKSDDVSKTTPDTYLRLTARFFHKLHSCGEFSA